MTSWGTSYHEVIIMSHVVIHDCRLYWALPLGSPLTTNRSSLYNVPDLHIRHRSPALPPTIPKAIAWSPIMGNRRAYVLTERVLESVPSLALLQMPWYRGRRCHTRTDAASPSPCSPACDALNPVHLWHAYASVSPNAQAPDSPLQIL
jgi:hypothetical protein